jgi:DNA polymerase
MQSLGADLETFSEVDLKKSGLHNYATHPSTGAHVLSYGPDPEHIKTWVEGEPFPEDLKIHIKSGGIITAWNAAFEWSIWNLCCVPKYGWPPLPISQVRCSMVRAYAMALPGALEDAAQALGVDQRKDAEGHRIMLQLSKPKKDGTMWRRDADSLDKFLKMYEYNRQDVRTELACLDRLRELSPSECALWELDHKINNRGVLCDLPSIEKAIAIVEAEQKRLNGEMLQVTGGVVGSCNEVQMLGKWIKSQGVEMDGLAKADVLNALAAAGDEDGPYEEGDDLPPWITPMPPAVRRALELRQEAAKSSTAKLVAMRNKASADGRLRNTHQYHAASTGRWAGRGVQPQNLSRYREGITQDDIDAMFSMLDDKAMLDLFYGPTMAAVSDCIRGMLIAGEGNELVACDFSAVEARVLPWLAGQESVLSIFRTHGKIYEHAAASIYHVPLDEVTKDQRQRGKVAILALGFGSGVGGFQTMAKNYNVHIPDEEADEIKKAWRAANQSIVQYWYDLENAVIFAMRNGGIAYAGAGGRQVKFRKAGSFLWALLPSDRVLCYPYPELRMVMTPWGEEKEQLTFMTVVDQTQKKKAKTLPDPNSKGRWQRVSTYGGSLAENMTQAIARDLLADAMVKIEAEGIEIVFHVHDELVAEVKQFRAQYVLERMEALMSTTPAWAKGLPLAAEAWYGKRYRK